MGKHEPPKNPGADGDRLSLTVEKFLEPPVVAVDSPNASVAGLPNNTITCGERSSISSAHHVWAGEKLRLGRGAITLAAPPCPAVHHVGRVGHRQVRVLWVDE